MEAFLIVSYKPVYARGRAVTADTVWIDCDDRYALLPEALAAARAIALSRGAVLFDAVATNNPPNMMWTGLGSQSIHVDP